MDGQAVETGVAAEWGCTFDLRKGVYLKGDVLFSILDLAGSIYQKGVCFSSLLDSAWRISQRSYSSQVDVGNSPGEEYLHITQTRRTHYLNLLWGDGIDKVHVYHSVNICSYS